jgi:hypothetical protein
MLAKVRSPEIGIRRRQRTKIGSGRDRQLTQSFKPHAMRLLTTCTDPTETTTIMTAIPLYRNANGSAAEPRGADAGTARQKH